MIGVKPSPGIDVVLKKCSYRLDVTYVQWLAEIAFEHVPFETLHVVPDAVCAINRAKLNWHLPYDLEEADFAARGLVFDHLPNGKFE